MLTVNDFYHFKEYHLALHHLHFVTWIVTQQVLLGVKFMQRHAPACKNHANLNVEIRTFTSYFGIVFFFFIDHFKNLRLILCKGMSLLAQTMQTDLVFVYVVVV